MTRFSNILSVYFAGCILIMAAIDLHAGLIYGVATVPLFLFLYVARNRPPFVMAPIVTAVIAFFGFYFIRPLVLIGDPAQFGYIPIGVPKQEVLRAALLYQGVYALFFLSGLYLVLHINMGRLRLPVSAFRGSTIAQLGPAFLFLLALLSVTWLILIFGFGVAQKGIKEGRLELLRLILPTTLIIPLAIGYLSRGAVSRLSATQRWTAYAIICANVLAILLAGSKAGLFLIVFYVLTYRIIMDGDFLMSLPKFLGISVLIVVLLFGSVLLAVVVRTANGLDMGTGVVSAMMFERSNVFALTFQTITLRLVGYEGIVAVLTYPPPQFAETANWSHIFMKTLGQLLPGISFPGLSVGKAVGVVFAGRDLDASHSGALGLVGTLQFMHGTVFGPVVAFLIGLFFGLLFRLVDRLCSQGAPERIVAFLALCHLQASWISSGNFDRLLQNTVILMAHMVFYYAVIRLFLQMTRRHQVPRGATQ